MSDDSPADQAFNPAYPNVARVYDYMLGGKNNFAADRQLTEQYLANWPTAVWSARQQRAFMIRAVRYCAQQGIDQYLDIGSGLPTMENVHEVARRINPGAAVVYVDNDRVAYNHIVALLATSPGTSAICADARQPGDILAQVEARGLLDLGRPMVVLMTGVLHFLSDDEDPAGILRVFRDAMATDSYLVLTQATLEAAPEEGERAAAAWTGPVHVSHRTREEFAAFFDGLDLVEPGVVPTVQWRPEEIVHDPELAGIYAAVGCKRRL